jgi:hypothetical protein
MLRTAFRMKSATTSGCESSTTCEELTSTVRVGAARLAMNRVFAVPIVLSWVATSAHAGIVFQAGGPETSRKACSASGRWPAAMSAVFSAGRSAAKILRNGSSLT